jgi:small-conductance mechanosensitive channel
MKDTRTVVIAALAVVVAAVMLVVAPLFAADNAPETPAPTTPAEPTKPVATTTATSTTKPHDSGFSEDMKTFVGAVSNTNEDSGLIIFLRVGIALAFLVLLVLLIWGTCRLAIIGKVRLRALAQRLKPIQFKSLTICDKPQMLHVADFLVTVVKWVLIIIEVVAISGVIFRFFEPTKFIADKLLELVLTPLKAFFFGFIDYIPKLITIAIIIVISHYILRFIKFVTMQIEEGKLAFHGFYAEWARPTYTIARVLIIAFTVAFIYPYLPNSDSNVFQGISVLVGLLFSFGSSSIISNVISGLVMTYMRPFKVGDRITMNGITGFVLERGPMVTRIRTHKNEIVSVPNSMVMNSAITNYSSAGEAGFSGLIIHADVTFGYSTPWQTVHEVLLAAAKKTMCVMDSPAPFVNQTGLDDFYCRYEINAYVNNVEPLPRIYSDLYTNIQNGFTEKGLSLYCPHFQVQQHTDSI